LSTGKGRRLNCRLLTTGGPVAGELALRPAGLRGDADQLIVAVTGARPAAEAPAPASGPDAPAAGGQESADLDLVRQLTRRQDLAADITRLLLENITVSESALLQRCARSLAGALGGWVIIDIERQGRLRRQFVTGPDDPQAEELTQVVADTAPEPGTAPWLVQESSAAQLISQTEDTDVLGRGPDGMPLVLLLRATSVLSVPLSDGERCHGALTLVRQASQGYFGLADMAVAESIGEHLGRALRADRMFRRQSAVAEALQASLLPRELPPVPGVEIAAAHVAAAGADVGGDFYDVFQTPDGPGLAIGDVCGTARDVATVTSAARHAIRVIARTGSDPAGILRGANDVLLGENLAGQFVTAHAGLLRWDDDRLIVALGSAGPPGPMLLAQDGQVRSLRGGGQPLGIFADAESSVQEIRMSPGDVLVFFTDGVADARHPEHGYFGDRLADELAALAGRPAADIVAGLHGTIREFCGGEARDDMTMLALRAVEPPDF
jgi:serine phosphatase RsbU (regulator of sigma subunit)